MDINLHRYIYSRTDISFLTHIQIQFILQVHIDKATQVQTVFLPHLSYRIIVPSLWWFDQANAGMVHPTRQEAEKRVGVAVYICCSILLLVVLPN